MHTMAFESVYCGVLMVKEVGPPPFFLASPIEICEWKKIRKSILPLYERMEIRRRTQFGYLASFIMLDAKGFMPNGQKQSLVEVESK